MVETIKLMSVVPLIVLLQIPTIYPREIPMIEERNFTQQKEIEDLKEKNGVDWFWVIALIVSNAITFLLAWRWFK